MGKGQPSHLRAAARLIAVGVQRGRTSRGGTERPATPARRLAVERSEIVATPARVRRYLSAVGGERLATPAAGDPLPPTYSAVWETALTLELLALDGMPFPSAGVIHLRSEIVSLRPLRIGERIRSRVELDRADPVGRGVQLLLRSRSWNGAGQLCQENETELLVRSRGREEGARSRGDRPAREEEVERPVWQERARWSLPGDAGFRYARASGDFNPIHLWPWSARLLGFSRPILHGHCSMAMIAQELGRRAGGDFRKLEARFRAPLMLPAKVRLQVAEGEPTRFRLEDEEAGKAFVEGSWVGGRAEVRS